MSESESRSVGRDALGIVLFGGAAFASISVWMAFKRPLADPAGEVVGSAVAAFVGAVGFVPALALTVGTTLLGARIWLFSRGEHLTRHLLGLAGLTAGMSVLAGAVAADAGGLLGAWTGEKVASFMSPLVSVPFGLACLLLPVWFAWARPRQAISWNVGQDPAPPAAVPPATEVEGVSAAEAAALLPRVPPAPAVYEPPPSPYPPDVRLVGRIPEGAQPIHSDDEPRSFPAFQDSSHEAALLGQPLEEPETASEPFGADLAGAAAGPLAGGASSHHIEFARGAPSPRGGVPAAAETVRPLEAPQGAQPLDTADLPRPSWEQASLFEEEPVDAYGTPLSVLASHRGDDLGAVVDPPDVPFEPGEVSLAERAAAPDQPQALDEPQEDGEPEADDEEADDEEEAVGEGADEDFALEPEPRVELQPRRAPAAAPAPAVDDDLVRRAALLFLERKRVAVSMLQREFDLDFEQSTIVLDQLQERGLIGPYKGGQRRDILMTADEWERRAATT